MKSSPGSNNVIFERRGHACSFRAPSALAFLQTFLKCDTHSRFGMCFSLYFAFLVFFVAPASSDPVPSAGWGGSVTTRSRTTSPENRSKEVRMSTMHCRDLSPVASTRPSILAHLRARIERSNVQRFSFRRGKGSSTSWTHSDTSYTDVRPCRLGPKLASTAAGKIRVLSSSNSTSLAAINILRPVWMDDLVFGHLGSSAQRLS